MYKRAFSFVSVIALTLLAGGVSAQGITDATVHGNTVRATIALPGGVGADLSIRFEDVVGLSVANLGLSAALVNPSDLGLLARLPAGGLVSIPAAFPVVVTVEPPATGPLSFTGVATIEIHTHNLALTGGCPLRMFRAPLGGPFEDITVSMGTGSYRARGTGPGFSQFLLVADLRPVGGIAAAKMTALRSQLSLREPLIDPDVYDELDDELATAETAAAAGDHRAAVRAVETFIRTVERHSGADIPDVWRATRDLDNVAGELRTAAGTLRLSLLLQGP